MLTLQTYTTAAAFLAETAPTFRADEVRHGLIYGIAERLRTSPEHFQAAPYLATVHAGERLAAAALMTPPHNLLVVATDAEPAASFTLIAQNLVADGWQPIFFHPEKAGLAWGDALAKGRAKRDPSLGELEVYAGPPLAICEEHEVPGYLDFVRPHLALYIGGMGARGKNFYNELACRYGYEAEAARIQDLYLDGKKDEAAAAVPDELVRSVSLIGPASYVAERVEAFREAGATTLTVTPMALDADGRIRLVEQFRDLC